ncbi:exopolysaccharide biosynthesis polyprenyl glycosylphosphotransferase [Streptomyces zhihengii]
MTTESAPAPHPASLTATRRVPSVHPPRGAAGRRPAAHARRRIRHRRRPFALLAADAAAACLATLLVPAVPWPAPAAAALLALAGCALHTWRGLYRRSLSPSALAELPALFLLAVVQWYALAEAFTAYAPHYATGPAAVACGAALQALLACAGRAAVHRARRRTAARRPRSALVVGRGPVAQQITAALYAHPGYGMRPVGRVDLHHVGGPADPTTLPVLLTPEDVSRAVIQNAVRHALFTAPPENPALPGLFAEHGCRIWLVDGGAAYPAGGPAAPRVPRQDHLWGFAVRPLETAVRRATAARAAKRAMDAAVAGVALLAASPVLAFCALAVRCADGPGVIFRQERVGLDGEPFTLLKFRTLRPSDEHESATRWSVARDRRMSRTGSILRRTSLDELPQLWNVLRGDMSLVGPRPERPYFVAKFSHTYPGYAARHRMPAGITGLAQVNGLRGDTSIEERARFDNHYIDTWSLWQDVCILLRTAASLFRLGGS